jgi:hypothetical protein
MDRLFFCILNQSFFTNSSLSLVQLVLISGSSFSGAKVNGN